MLDQIAADKYSLKILNSENQVKILVYDQENYPTVIKDLINKKTQYYTYRNKATRGYKFVLRSMHPSVDLKDLKSEIESHGHTVLNISNIKKAISKVALPLFFVEIKTQDNNKDIYKITRLLNTIVTFEPPRKKRELPQCSRCQDLTHTQRTTATSSLYA